MRFDGDVMAAVRRRSEKYRISMNSRLLRKPTLSEQKHESLEKLSIECSHAFVSLSEEILGAQNNSFHSKNQKINLRRGSVNKMLEASLEYNQVESANEKKIRGIKLENKIRRGEALHLISTFCQMNAKSNDFQCG